MNPLRGFTRLIHWGPLIAIGIIKCITFVSLYMNAMWWPPNRSIGGFIHQTIFLMLSALTAFNFVMGSLNGPRYLPLGWRPINKKDELYLQYCFDCVGYKAPRSHHCKKCNRCVMKMDHHCPWINNCVGWGNHAHFTCFLGFAVLGCLQATIILSITLYRGIHRQWYLYYGFRELATVHLTIWSLIMCVFSLGLAVGVVIAVGMLLYFQLRAIKRNRTGIEEWILEKAKYRRNENEEFIYPYDLGTKRNIQQVLNWNCEPVGDGITWEVVPGTDQYTLTREQLAQKNEKRARSRVYLIIKPVSGSWIPFWSQGFKITCNPPCTDEPRLRLKEGDLVSVTRKRKYWLFGEKLPDNEVPTERKRLRGWFPRPCAIEHYESNLYDSLDKSDNQNHRSMNEKHKKIN